MFKVKQIEFNKACFLGGKNLRFQENKMQTNPIIDESIEDFYFGIFDDDSLIGTCTFVKKDNEDFESSCAYQLKNIFIDATYNEKNLDWNLLVHAEAFLKNNKSILIWCNACVVQVPFYEKNGFYSEGNSFEVSNLGLHKVMYKVL